MKYLYRISFLLILVMGTTSCLKEDLPEYPLWEENAITNVYVEYRFEGPKDYLGDPIVSYRRLDVVQDINPENGRITLDITVPSASGDFTEEVRAQVTNEQLWMYVDLSTAATIEPINGTPPMGDPADLTQPLHFRVTAANGDQKDWEIVTSSFTK